MPEESKSYEAPAAKNTAYRSHQKIEEMNAQEMKELANMIKEELPQGYGFALVANSQQPSPK